MRELELMIRMQNPTSATHFRSRQPNQELRKAPETHERRALSLSLSLSRARDMSLNANAIIGAADNKTGEHRLARR
jgi:hypothetical protein